MTKKFDVAVCCCNEGVTIRRCLTSIQAHADYERLIVVDDASTDSTRKVAELFADVLLDSGKRLIGYSRQLALKESDQEVLLFVDGDVEIMKDVSPIIGAVRKRTAAVRGRNYHIINRRFTFKHSWGVGFGLTAINTDAARKIGGFSEMGAGEDLDFCRRLTAKGYRATQIGDPVEREDEEGNVLKEGGDVFGIHYKSSYSRLPPRSEWPCENFDEVVHSIAEADPGKVIAALGTIDANAVPGVVAEAVKYGADHQLRRRRAIVIGG